MKQNPHRVRILAGLVSLAMFQLASAQTAPATEDKDAPLNLDKVVVTGTSQAGSKLKQSISISTIGSEQIEKSGAGSTADLLRTIPGVRSEASGGEGNANITVRGVPVSAGGARYTQFQKNGLPVLLFGDFNFVTSDMFLRADYSVDRVEVVRSGSGSTLSTNSPAGIINFVSKTGEQAGGAVGVSVGLGHKSNRVDFEYGAPLSKDTSYYFGGYYRNGEGPRKTNGVTSEDGGQISGNILHKLGGGSFVRLDLNALNDKTPTYLPVLVSLTNGVIGEAPGINPRTTTPYSTGLRLVPDFGVRDKSTVNINDGLKVSSTSIGGEFNYNLGDGWNINDKARFASNSGGFYGLLANSTYVAGLNKIDQLFLGAKFNDVGLNVNDLKVSKGFAIDAGSKITASVGLYLASQKADIDWEIGGLPTTYANNGAVQTGPYTSFFKHYINVKYDTTAPYALVAYEAGPLSVDFSLRSDRQTAKGIFTLPDLIAGSNVRNVNYKSNYLAKSLGGNYQLSKDYAFFARYSEGAAFNSDRVLFSGAAACGANCFVGATIPVNEVKQFEVGAKFREGPFSSFVTLFNARTKETNYDLTTFKSTANSYRANGLEVEIGFRAGDFRLGGGFTYTDAKITGEAPGTPPASSLIGFTPDRQAKVVYQLNPSYRSGPIDVGAFIVGTTSSRDAQSFARPATLPGYTTVNPYLIYSVTPQIQVNLNVNNLLNAIGYTEYNSDGRTAARSIAGRTIRLGVKYSF